MALPRIFLYSGRQEVDDSHLDNIYGEPKTLAVIKLDSCDIKPVSLLNISQKNKVLKNSLMVLFDTGANYSCVKANSYHLGKIQSQRGTLFRALNETFLSNKESEVELNFTEFSERKIIACKFHVLPGKKLSYDVIIGHNLMK